jgi:hypothetical protein
MCPLVDRGALEVKPVDVPIISAAAGNNVPAVYIASDFVRDGGLLSYGVDTVDAYRRAATYVDRILRGAKPGDLPVQLPVKYEMVVNRIDQLLRPAAAISDRDLLRPNRPDGQAREETREG